MVLWKSIYTIHRRQREWGKKLSRATLPDVIKAYSLLYRLDFICFKSKSSVSKHLFTNLFGKKTKQNTPKQAETHKKQPPKPNQQLFTPQKARLHSHRPALIQKLQWHWGSFHRGGLLVGSRPQQSQESSRQWQHRAHKARHRARFTVLFCGLGVKKPAGGATSSSQHSHLSEHLLEISVSVGYNSAPLLLSHFC